jgi:hypothetical protein
MIDSLYAYWLNGLVDALETRRGQIDPGAYASARAALDGIWARAAEAPLTSAQYTLAQAAVEAALESTDYAEGVS